MKLHYRCLFIDDTKELSVPYDLRIQQEAGILDMDWVILRSLYDVANDPAMEERFHVVVFDYYLNAKGTQTGIVAMLEIHSLYTENGWTLPLAAFNSSDSSMNTKMAKQWLDLGGSFVDNDLQVRMISESADIARKADKAMSFLSNYSEAPRQMFGVKKTGKGVKRKGGRP